MIYKCGDFSGSAAEFADRLAELAVCALLTEVCITPKPGLVDRANCGAHEDMDIFTFVGSAASLFPCFRDIAMSTLTYDGNIGSLLSHLTPIGLRGEGRMFQATGGINTHKGAIFSLGILCAAAAFMAKQPGNRDEKALRNTCIAMAKDRTRDGDPESDNETKGRMAYLQHGISGILGEAAAGFPNVFQTALPHLRKHLQSGSTIEDAGVAALLHLITTVDDTNIIARCGMEILREIQSGVKAEIAAFHCPQQYITYAQALDQRFIRQNISPGGSADLLAAALFVHGLFPHGG